MPLSRLENFLKNIQGNVIYVDPNELDATDSIENQGNSQTRPFKTIQRALIEASRFSYVAGQRNDKFDLTTIILSAGTHYVDNRPGWVPYNTGSTAKYYTRFGNSNQVLSPFGLGSNFDLTASDNELYKLNSVRGGVIIPRGTSIVGKDLRKTKIRPKYVPDPENDLIESSAIFRLTGGCYISQFTIFDGDPAGNVYKDYTSNLYTPSFSHHKLTCFEYVDGANAISIKDSFLNISSTSTDLDMYYQKVGDVYDAGTGRPIEPDFPSGDLDFQTRVEEYRIVGSTGQQVGISSIKAGDGASSGTVITVDMESSLTDLSIDTPIRISGISTSGYDGIHVVSEVVSNTQFKYVVSSAPNNPLPTITSASVNIEIDTINSASPYLFNLSKRSVFGMNGILLDGSKVTGFKSGLMAQFTGNALQKDDKAFVRYNTTSGQYDDYTSVNNLHLDPEAVYKPAYTSSHVKASNDAVIQAVSVFAIGHNNQYVAESGGELSLSNCNANFGENALLSEGYKTTALGPDNSAYITHLIPPKEITDGVTNVDYLSVDVDKTIGVGTVTRLYFEGYTNQDAPPPYIVDGYRVGSNRDDKLKVQLNINNNEGDFKSRIVMPTATGITTNTGEKRYIVDNNVGVTSISSNIISLKTNHSLIDGESVRIFAENGFLPDGLEEDTIYFAIVSGLNSNDLKVARTVNDALDGTALTINNTGGELTVVSKVSDKKSGDIGHPIQFDIPNKNWYINVSNETIDNEIYPTIVGVGTTALGPNTPKTYFTRTDSSRGIEDSIYKFRYVIPAGITTARPPIEGYVIQETSDTTGSSDAEITTTSLTNIDDQRNFHFINEATWNTNVATVMTEEPHDLEVGAVVNVNKITSANNATGIGSSGFNGRYSVIGITSARGFQYSLTDNPGTSTIDVNTRTVDNLANFEKNESARSFYVYRSEEVKKHITGEQDGVYHLTALHYDVKPSVAPFTGFKFSQPVKDLYPQVDRDNPTSDPDTGLSHAVSKTIGKVVSNELGKSITRDTSKKFLLENGLSVGITSIVSDNGAGLAHTAYLEREHTLSSVIGVGIQSAGWKYGAGSATTLYGAKLVGVGVGSTSGSGATANVVVNNEGQITSVTIVNGGGAYGIGNSLEVTGITTQAGYVSGILTVTNVYEGVGQVIQIAGITSDTNSKLNNTFKVTEVPDAKRVCFASTEVIDYGRSLGGSSNNIAVGAALSNSSMSMIGPAIGVTSLNYDVNSGIATVGTGVTAHGLLAGSKIKIVGAGQTVYQGEFIVKEKVNLTTFTVDVGISTVSAPTLTGDVFAFPGGYSSADGGITSDDEKIGSRMNSLYVGITTTLSSGITSTSSAISITNSTKSGLNIGDYIMVNDEMMRIKNTSINQVFRGVFGSKSTNHDSGTIIRKVKVVPVELRRNSLIRAANQTFEYVGFGQGNYSVALPEKQTKVLSTEDRKLGQTQKRNGGQNYYTGLNDSGEYFIGNKVIKGTTGEEEIFDAPIITVNGEDKDIDTSFTDVINVSGGTNKDALSELNGPALFTNKITSTSSEGIEAVSLQLQGDGRVARKITVGISTPTSGGTAGDIVFDTKPSQGGNAGWIFTTENQWRRFGQISKTSADDTQTFDKVGIGTSTPRTALHVYGPCNQVRIEDSTGSADLGFCTDNFKIDHAATADRKTSLLNSGTGSLKVGIGTTDPDANLEVYTENNNNINALTLRTGKGANGMVGLAFASNFKRGREKASIFFVETNSGNPHYTGDLVFALDTHGGNASQVETTDEKFRITKTGKVGVNWGSTSGFYETIHVQEPAGNGVAGITLSHLSSSNRYGFRFQSLAGANQGLTLSRVYNTTYTEVLRLDTGGRFGFNQTSPNADNVVHIKSDNTIDNPLMLDTSVAANNTNLSFAKVGALKWLVGNKGNDDGFRIHNQALNDEAFTIAPTGFVGVNTSSPSSQLNVMTTHASGGQIASFLNDDSGGNMGGLVLSGGEGGRECRLESAYSNSWMAFHTNNGSTTVEGLRILANGKVTIGGSNSSTNSALNVVASATTTDVTDGTNAAIVLKNSSNTDNGYSCIRFQNSVNDEYARILGLTINADYPSGGGTAGGVLAFLTEPTSGGINERMRLDTDGNLLFNKTSTSASTTGIEIRGNITGAQIRIGKSASGTVNGIYLHHNASYVGGLNYTDTATALVTSSDYRLKKDVESITGAIDRVKRINPVSFNWISNGKSDEGFIAHELSDIIPNAVFGEKDAVDIDTGEIKVQSVSKETLIPVLTAALKEAITKIEILESEVAELKSS